MSRRIDLANGSWSHIYRFIAYHLFSSVGFTSAIWILYLQHRGYSLTQIGIGEAAFHLAPILLEVPSGSFADMIGRRWSLVVSSTLVALSAALFLGATTFPIVLAAMFLSGASMSFRSGADQAFLFDALTADQQTRYGRVFGRLLSAGYILSGVTMWLGAWFSDIDYAIPYTLSIVFAIVSIVFAIGLNEPARERHHHGAAGFFHHLRDVRILLRQRTYVAFMLVTAAVYWVGVAAAEIYVQALFADRGLSNAQIGAFLGVMFVAVAGGTALGGQLTGRLTWQWPLLTAATGIGVIILGVANAMVIIIGAYIVAEFVSGIAETRLSAWYNAQLPSGQRATVLSVESWLFSILMIGFFPLAGWFAERAGWTAMYIVIGGVMIATGASAMVLRRHPQTSVVTAVAEQGGDMPMIPDRIAWAVDLLDVQPDDRILEVGCGNGAAVSLIAPRLVSGLITGIDRSEKAVVRASTVNAGHIASGRARIIQATLQEFEPEEEGYDKVVAVNVNAFWLHPEQELPSARRHLAPGGTLLLVLEAPSAERAREFLAIMPGHLESHGFEAISTLSRTGKTVAVSARFRR